MEIYYFEKRCKVFPIAKTRSGNAKQLHFHIEAFGGDCSRIFEDKRGFMSNH